MGGAVSRCERAKKSTDDRQGLGGLCIERFHAPRWAGHRHQATVGRRGSVVASVVRAGLVCIRICSPAGGRIVNHFTAAYIRGNQHCPHTGAGTPCGYSQEEASSSRVPFTAIIDTPSPFLIHWLRFHCPLN